MKITFEIIHNFVLNPFTCQLSYVSNEQCSIQGFWLWLVYATHKIVLELRWPLSNHICAYGLGVRCVVAIDTTGVRVPVSASFFVGNQMVLLLYIDEPNTL